MTTHTFDVMLADETDALAFWNIVETRMAAAVALHSDPSSVESDLQFHRRALLAMVAAGFHHMRYIQVDTGMFPIARSGGYEEHWWTVGSLLNCSFEPPCTPEQLVQALAHVPALADPYIHPRMLTACQLTPSEEGCEFDVPTSIDQYIQQAPKKQRSEWGRLLRKAMAAGITPERPGSTLTLAAADSLIEQYAAYWADRNDSYSDESQMMRQTLKAFAEADPRHWLGVVINDAQGVPVAVNLAWIKQGTVFDTICIRDVREDLRPYSLGVLAILYNLTACSELGLSRYSLASGDQQYKRQFNYEKPTEQQHLTCLSDIDIVLKNYPGYYHGQWVTADQPVELDADVVAYIHDQYPFTLEEKE